MQTTQKHHRPPAQKETTKFTVIIDAELYHRILVYKALSRPRRTLQSLVGEALEKGFPPLPSLQYP